MNILDLVPLSWFSADMNVFSDGVLLAELHFSRWRENGSIVSESRHYAVHKDVMFSNRFLLEIDGRSYCQAQFKTSWTRTVSMEYEGVSYVLKWTAMSRRVQVLRDGLESGAVCRRGFWGRRAQAEFREEIPLVTKAFMLWLICLGWNRDAAG
jgi:hypothetical protein